MNRKSKKQSDTKVVHVVNWPLPVTLYDELEALAREDHGVGGKVRITAISLLREALQTRKLRARERV